MPQKNGQTLSSNITLEKGGGTQRIYVDPLGLMEEFLYYGQFLYCNYMYGAKQFYSQVYLLNKLNTYQVSFIFI